MTVRYARLERLVTLKTARTRRATARRPGMARRAAKT
jgi:hypothetical protein